MRRGKIRSISKMTEGLVDGFSIKLECDKIIDQRLVSFYTKLAGAENFVPHTTDCFRTTWRIYKFKTFRGIMDAYLSVPHDVKVIDQACLIGCYLSKFRRTCSTNFGEYGGHYNFLELVKAILFIDGRYGEEVKINWCSKDFEAENTFNGLFVIKQQYANKNWQIRFTDDGWRIIGKVMEIVKASDSEYLKKNKF